MTDLPNLYVLVEVTDANNSLTHACVATLIHTNTGHLNFHGVLILCKSYLYKIELILTQQLHFKILIYSIFTLVHNTSRNSIVSYNIIETMIDFNESLHHYTI